jgi:flagellar protein FliO/FliZ
METFALSFASMLLVLALVLAIAWGVLRLARSRLQPRPAGAKSADDVLRFVRALPVGSKERIVLIEHRGERWLLGVTSGGISTIGHWRSDAASGSASFASPPEPR